MYWIKHGVIVDIFTLLKINYVSYPYRLMLGTSKLLVDLESKIYPLKHENIQL